MPAQAIKIITINTWKSDANYADRMIVLADQLKDLDADIILCQECFALPDNSVNTITTLGRALQLDSVFTPARLKRRQLGNEWTDSYSGLGILSRFPVTILKEFAFNFVSDDGERKVQIAAITISDTKKIIVVNVHLTHLANATELRSEQIRRLAEELVKLDLSCIRIIGGDFNTEINSVELNLLQSILLVKDCYALGNGGVPKDPPNAFQVQKAIDHLFVLPDANGRYPEIKNSAVVLNKQHTARKSYASDHPGISATLILED